MPDDVLTGVARKNYELQFRNLPGTGTMRTPEELADMRAKMIEHLEAALAIADETQDGTPGYLIEQALDAIRASMWPGNLDLSPPRK